MPLISLFVFCVNNFKRSPKWIKQKWYDQRWAKKIIQKNYSEHGMFNSFNYESDWLQYQLIYMLLYNWLNKVCHACFVLTRCIIILILWTNQNNHLTISMWPMKEIPWTSHDWHQNCILLVKYLEIFFLTNQRVHLNKAKTNE